MVVPIVISKKEILSLYNKASEKEINETLVKLGPLERAFSSFLNAEAKLKTVKPSELVHLFDECSDTRISVDGLYSVLWQLCPGGDIVGHHEVNMLVDHLRLRTSSFLERSGKLHRIAEHDHAFGSGGDFVKTIHATTSACIILAPLVKFCKTGTVNVTSHYGSSQAIAGMGYSEGEFIPAKVNHLLEKYGFAFVSLASLGYPYSQKLREARKRLWDIASSSLHQNYNAGIGKWRTILQNTEVPIDIFKIISPNAQLLNPLHHSTGVCHISMIPYVLSVYLHLGCQGVIVHGYDGIDEVSNASVDEIFPNNVFIHIGREYVKIVEFSPDDIGIVRCSIEEIQEDEDIAVEAKEFWNIISGVEKGPKREFLVANAAALLVASGKVKFDGENLIEMMSRCVTMVNDLIDSGRSYENFKRLVDEVQGTILD